MSVWFCVTHGRVAPVACCNQAEREEAVRPLLQDELPEDIRARREIFRRSMNVGIAPTDPRYMHPVGWVSK